MLQIEHAFISHGYSGLTMERIAECCNFSRRALYFYFSSKSEAFRASVQFRNDLGLSTGFAAGRKRRSEGGSALDIFSAIINARFGDLRRVVHASPHLVELNAEVFARCNDIVKKIAASFETELTRLIIETQRDSLLRLRADVTAEQVAQALSNGARGVNQRLPAVAPNELEDRYRDMCRFILYGCAEMPIARSRESRSGSRRKTDKGAVRQP